MKRRRIVTNPDKIMHKSCPCALGDLKIVLAGGKHRAREAVSREEGVGFDSDKPPVLL